MITLLAAFAIARQAPNDPAALVSKMLARYAEAQQLSGQMRFTQSAADKQVVVDTWLQYERPSKLYLKQVRHSSDPGTFLVTSDGTQFSYDAPASLSIHPPRLVEPVLAHGAAQDIAQLYHVAGDSLGEQGSPALAIAIGYLPDLKSIRGTWATMTSGGETEVRGIKVTAVRGNYRDSATQPVSGTYEIDIDKDSNLIRYSTQQNFSLPNSPGESVQVTSLWDLDLKVGVVADPSLFKVVR